MLDAAVELTLVLPYKKGGVVVDGDDVVQRILCEANEGEEIVAAMTEKRKVKKERTGSKRKKIRRKNR